MALLTEIRRKPSRPSPEETASTANEDNNRVCLIPIADIIPNRSQPRSAFNQNAIARLSDSIRRYGILQPLTVRRVRLPAAITSTQELAGISTVYELIAGERRLRAAKLAGMESVPCIIINTDDATSAELAIIENLLRENLNMFEQAEAFLRLIREFHLTQDEAARRVSMSQSAVANKLRLLRLSPEERQKILSSGLTERHARALLKLSDETLRGEVLDHILERRMNVSATESYIEQIVCEISRFQYKNVEMSVEETPKAERPKEEPPLPKEIRAVLPGRRNRFKGAIKDMQLFYNSVRNAVNILESVGIVGEIQRQESEEQVILTITLSKSDRRA